MVRNANSFRHGVIRPRRNGIRLRYSVTILRRECPHRAVAGVASAAVAAHIAPAVAEACVAPAVAITSVAALTAVATAGDSDEGVDRLRVPQFPLHPKRSRLEARNPPSLSKTR